MIYYLLEFERKRTYPFVSEIHKLTSKHWLTMRFEMAVQGLKWQFMFEMRASHSSVFEMRWFSYG